MGNRAVVASSVTRSQDDDVSVSWRFCISLPSLCCFRDIEVPLWLCLEVTWLRPLVVHHHREQCVSGPIVAIVVDGHVTEEFEEDDKDGKARDGQNYGSGAAC
jgi:hypothetical protein